MPILFTYDNRIMSVRDDARNRCLDTLHIGLITEDGVEVQPKPITIRMGCDGSLTSTTLITFVGSSDVDTLTAANFGTNLIG